MSHNTGHPAGSLPAAGDAPATQASAAPDGVARPPDPVPPRTGPALDPWGVAALLACALCWSFSGPLIKTLNAGGEADGVGGFVIAFYRSLFGGLAFLPLAIARCRTLAGVPLGWPIASVATFTLMTACFVVANTMTAAANAIVLQYTSAIWVFALAPLVLGERPQRSDFAWLLPAMAGIGLILALQWESDLPGLLVALAAGLGYGALTVVLRGMRAVDPAMVVALNFLGSAAVLFPLAATEGLVLHGQQWVWMLALGIGQMAVPYLLFSWALQRVAAPHAALIVLLEAVLNPILTWLFVGEQVPMATLLGGPLILLSVAGRIVYAARSRRAASLQ